MVISLFSKNLTKLNETMINYYVVLSFFPEHHWQVSSDALHFVRSS